MAQINRHQLHQHNKTFNLSTMESETTLIPLLDRRRESSPDVLRQNTEAYSTTVHSNTRTNESAYRTSISLTNCEHRNSTTQSRNRLTILIKITDILLIIGAVIVAISLCITFSTVGLAIVRMYFMEGNHKLNVTKKHFPSVNE